MTLFNGNILSIATGYSMLSESAEHCH